MSTPPSNTPTPIMSSFRQQRAATSNSRQNTNEYDMHMLSYTPSHQPPPSSSSPSADVDADDTTMHCGEGEHGRTTLAQLNDYRREGFLTDVVIKIGTTKFPAHRNVLAATIPYFRAMFSSQMVETKMDEIELQDMNESSFGQLLDYAYTAKIDVTAGNVQTLWFAATILQMDDVCATLQHFINKRLSIEDCLAVRQFVAQFHCLDMMRSVDLFICDHFQHLRETEEFLSISADHFIDLISSSDLHVVNETQVYETVIAWVSFIPVERRRHLPRLLAKVRLAQITTDYLLNTIRQHPLIKDDDACRNLIFEALAETLTVGGTSTEPCRPPSPDEASSSTNANYANYERCTDVTYTSQGRKFQAPKSGSTLNLSLVAQSADQSSTRSTPLSPRWSRPRKSAAGVIFCVGGRGTLGDPFRTVEAFDWRRNQWFTITDMNVRRRHVGVVSAHHKLYAIGGHDGEHHLSSAECYDSLTNRWTPTASMQIRRRGIAVGALEGAIYAVGGLDDTSCFPTVERYDVELDTWCTVAPMNVQRGGVGVAALGKYLYAVGGNDGTTSLDSCERFDPHLNKWTITAAMQHRRAGAGVTVLDGSMYAIGGFDDNAPLSSCERFDPVMQRWTPLPKMSRPRGGVGVAALGGRIYAVGGHDGRAYLDSVEAYDPCADAWTTVTNISACRAGAGVAWCDLRVDQLTRPPSYSSTDAPSNSGGGVAYCV